MRFRKTLALQLACSVVALAANSASADPRLLVTVKDANGKPTGIHQKVIVAANDATIHPKASESDGEPIEAFSIFFQLKTDGGDDKEGEWIRVGDGDGKPLGWIRDKSLIEWSSRFLLYPRSPTPSEPKRLYRVISDDGDEMEMINVPTGRAAISPILAQTPKGSSDYPVAFFYGETKGESKGTLIPETEQLSDLELEVMFVIDTTASMTDLLEGAKDVVRRTAEELRGNAELKAAVRLGLVQYQDATPGLKPSELVSPLTDVDEFLKRLEPLRVASIGSQEVQEDVLAGMKTALDDSGWKENSAKHIVLLGDASAHVSGPKNTTGLDIDRLIGLARKPAGAADEQERGSVTMHAVRAKQPNSLGDGAICRAQFEKLAQNAGEIDGKYIELDPSSQQDIDRSVEQLLSVLRFGIKGLSAARQGNTAQLQQMIQQDPNNAAIANQIWRIVNSSGKATAAHEKPVLKGKARDRDDQGQLVANRKLLLGESELKRLKSTLDFLYTNLESRTDPASRGDVSTILDVLQQVAVIVGTGEKRLAPDVPLAEIISDLPMKTDALKITAADLQAYPPAEFTAWLEKLQAASNRAQDLLDSKLDNVWLPLSNKAVNAKYTFVRLEEMP